jgi:hypothetical protein
MKFFHATTFVPFVLALGLLALAPAARAAAEEEHDDADLRAQLVTFDGEVVRLAERPGEGGLGVVAAMLRTLESPPREVEVLLAPAGAMLAAGLVVEAGDHLRVRAFPAERGPLLVHRIWNLTHRGDARLRTLRRDPVWNGDGDWQGKAAESCPYQPPAEPEAGSVPPPR